MTNETDTLTFVVPLPENLGNARLHHMVKHRRKVGYWDTLDMLVPLTGRIGMSLPDPRRLYVPPAPVTPWPAGVVRVTYHIATKPMDADNAVSRFKWIGDWLTTRGYVSDDTRDALTWDGFPRQVKCKRNAVRVEVTLRRRQPNDVAA
jgi:hypothetical protein